MCTRPCWAAGASYLAFITGNLINLKLPCAANAREICGTEVGTPENDIVSTLSVATSSLVTVVVLARGRAVPCAAYARCWKRPVLQPAFNNVIPALFGALAFKYFSKSLLLAAAPLAVMCVLFVARARADWAGVVPYPAGRRAFHCAGVADVPQGQAVRRTAPAIPAPWLLRHEKGKRGEKAAFPAQRRENFC